MEQFITRSAMMERLQTGEVSSLVYCSLSVQSKKGGDRLELPECVMLMPEHDHTEDYRTTGRRMTVLEEKAQIERKSPNHKKHYTRNFRMVVDGVPINIIKKIHIRLIEKFNGLSVVP